MCGGGTNNFFENVLDAAIGVGTGGTAGYKNGKLGTGIMQREIGGIERGTDLRFDTLGGVVLTKELTGANAAEQANKDAREQFEKTKEFARVEREQAQSRNAATQIAKSRQAAGARRGSGSSSAPGLSTLGTDERDLLGV